MSESYPQGSIVHRGIVPELKDFAYMEFSSPEFWKKMIHQYWSSKTYYHNIPIRPVHGYTKKYNQTVHLDPELPHILYRAFRTYRVEELYRVFCDDPDMYDSDSYSVYWPMVLAWSQLSYQPALMVNPENLTQLFHGFYYQNEHILPTADTPIGHTLIDDYLDTPIREMLLDLKVITPKYNRPDTFILTDGSGIYAHKCIDNSLITKTRDISTLRKMCQTHQEDPSKFQQFHSYLWFRLLVSALLHVGLVYTGINELYAYDR